MQIDTGMGNSLAYLVGGKYRAYTAVVLNLIERGFLSWEGENQKLTGLENISNEDWSSFDIGEQSIISSVSSKSPVYSPDRLPNELKVLESMRKNLHFSSYIEQSQQTKESFLGGIFGVFFYWFFLAYIIGCLFGLILEKSLGIGIIFILAAHLSALFIFLKYLNYCSPIPSYIFYPLAHDHVTAIANELIEDYKQHIPFSDHTSGIPLSMVYALYGDIALSDTRFNELNDFIYTHLHSPSFQGFNRRDFDFPNYYFDRNSSYDSHEGSSNDSDSYDGGGCGGGGCGGD